MNSTDSDLIKTFYTTKFASPLLRATDTARLDAYLLVAEKRIYESASIVIGQSARSFKKYFNKLTNIVELPIVPVIDLDYTSIKLDGQLLGYTADDYYNIYELSKSYVIFFDGIGPGLIEFNYTAGLAVVDNVCLAFSLLINHMLELKTVEYENVGVITIKADRFTLPQEVLSLLNANVANVGTA